MFNNVNRFNLSFLLVVLVKCSYLCYLVFVWSFFNSSVQRMLLRLLNSLTTSRSVLSGVKSPAPKFIWAGGGPQVASGWSNYGEPPTEAPPKSRQGRTGQATAQRDLAGVLPMPATSFMQHRKEARLCCWAAPTGNPTDEASSIPSSLRQAWATAEAL